MIEPTGPAHTYRWAKGSIGPQTVPENLIKFNARATDYIERSHKYPKGCKDICSPLIYVLTSKEAINTFSTIQISIKCFNLDPSNIIEKKQIKYPLTLNTLHQKMDHNLSNLIRMAQTWACSKGTQITNPIDPTSCHLDKHFIEMAI